MKNEKDQKNAGSGKRTDPKSTKSKNHLEGGRGANKNDDPAEDSKGGGNSGLGNQEGANQGKFRGPGNRH